MTTLQNKAVSIGVAGAFALAIAFIAPFEGFTLRSYQDGVGIWTICRGHTKGVKPGMTATAKECEAFFESDVGEAVRQADAVIKVPVTDFELAAYASFVYNIGIGAFQRSTMLRKLNAGDHVGACNQFTRWVYADNGRVDCRKRLNMCYGLVKRRAEERELCLTRLSN